MTILLVVEASTAAGSVALVRNGMVAHVRDVPMGASRDDQLLPAIDDVLRAASVAPAELAGIVCGSGPGSFTSLRIAASLCKGLASACDVPLFAVPSLLLAAAALAPASGRYLLHADALRGDRYVLAVDLGVDGLVSAASAPSRVSADMLAMLSSSDSRELVAVVAARDHAASGRSVVPHARGVVQLARALDAFGPVSLASWEPAYGRLAEAQVKWEVEHGRPLPAA